MLIAFEVSYIQQRLAKISSLELPTAVNDIRFSLELQLWCRVFMFCLYKLQNKDMLNKNCEEKLFERNTNAA